jgi:hypothetical protein
MIINFLLLFYIIFINYYIYFIKKYKTSAKKKVANEFFAYSAAPLAPRRHH